MAVLSGANEKVLRYVVCYSFIRVASVAQLAAPSDWRPGGRGVQPPPRSVTFFRGD